MDRDEKIARLEKWLKNYDSSKTFEKAHRLATTRTFEKDESGKWKRTPEQERGERMLREHDAVEHELLRQTDKRIIEELGLFDK